MNTKSKIIIATHVYTTGPAQDLKEYLLNNKIDKLFFIGHPLFFSPKLNGSGYEIYNNGKLIKKNYQKIRKIPEILSYLKDIWLNIYWIFISRDQYDLFIGIDNLNAFTGIILKWLGRAKKTVYYVIDYNPVRFNNKILNRIYHISDQFCVKYSDETWNLSAVMKTARKKYFNFSGGNQIEVPIGIWFKRIKRLDFDQINHHMLVYMGHITKKQGVQYILQAIPEIIKTIPDFQFLVIGGGEYLDNLKKLANELKIERCINFTGFIVDHKDVEKMLIKCSLAVAMYEKYDDNDNLSFTHFTDPGKIKSYLASGLPVLLTDVPPIAKTIEEKHCALIIDNDPKMIAQAVTKLMEDKKKLEQFRKNAIDFAKEFDWENIFSSILKGLL